MTDGYLSKDREHLARNQRQRRARIVRVDYMPDKAALAIIAIKREQCRPGSASATNSAVLDAILTEWADLTGIKYREVDGPKTSGRQPELINRNARAYEFGKAASRLLHASRAPARVGLTKCGAKRHCDGLPCQAKPEPGKLRCRFHGGRSTGPRTREGRARALANLRKGNSDPKVDK